MIKPKPTVYDLMRGHRERVADLLWGPLAHKKWLHAGISPELAEWVESGKLPETCDGDARMKLVQAVRITRLLHLVFIETTVLASGLSRELLRKVEDLTTTNALLRAELEKLERMISTPPPAPEPDEEEDRHG